MIPTDSPNTLISILPGYEHRRLFHSSRYKQDDLDSYDGFEILSHCFQAYRESTFDFQHALDDYPYMR